MLIAPLFADFVGMLSVDLEIADEAVSDLWVERATAMLSTVPKHLEIGATPLGIQCNAQTVNTQEGKWHG